MRSFSVLVFQAGRIQTTSDFHSNPIRLLLDLQPTIIVATTVASLSPVVLLRI